MPVELVDFIDAFRASLLEGIFYLRLKFNK
jgi:hypothetical protein